MSTNTELTTAIENDAKNAPANAVEIKEAEISLETAKARIKNERERLEKDRQIDLYLAQVNKDLEKIGKIVKAGDLINICGTAKKVVQFEKNGKTVSAKVDVYFLWRSDSITYISIHGLGAKNAPLERIAKHFRCSVSAYAETRGFTDVKTDETAVKSYKQVAKGFRAKEVVRLDSTLNGKTALLRVDSASKGRKQALSDASNLRILEKNYSKLCESELGERSKRTYIDTLRIADESRAAIAAEREAKKASKPTVKPSGRGKAMKVEPGSTPQVRTFATAKK